MKHHRNPNSCPSCAEPSVDGTDHVPGPSDLPEALCLQERKDGLGGWRQAGKGGRGGKKSRQPSEVGENDAHEPVLLTQPRRRASGTLVLGLLGQVAPQQGSGCKARSSQPFLLLHMGAISQHLQAGSCFSGA